jgi:hypothetical protein
MGPDQPPVKTTGSQTVRMLGNLWMIGEGEGECPDGTMAKSIITLGYDPEKQRFVGTFIASMMTHLWPYEGTLQGDVLTLDSEGPSFSGKGRANIRTSSKSSTTTTGSCDRACRAKTANGSNA